MQKIDLKEHPELVKEVTEKANKMIKSENVNYLTLLFKVLFTEFCCSDEAIEKVICQSRGNYKVAAKLAYDEMRSDLID